MPDELKTAEQLIEFAPDSALHILQLIPPNKYKANEARALYGLLMTQALDRKQLSFDPDTLLEFSMAYYQEHPSKDRLASCYLYKGRSYKYKFQYEMAMNYYLKAFDVLENKENYILLGRLNSDVGDIYLYQREYLKANKKYLQAYHYFKKANLATPAYHSLINIGKSFSQAKSYKSAQPYFWKVYIEAKDSLVKGMAVQHIGVNYYNALQYDSALLYFRKVIHYPSVKNSLSIRYYYLADLYFEMGQVDSAIYYASRSCNRLSDIRTERECYRILVNSANAKGNIPDLKKYMLKYQAASDSIRKIDSQTKGSVIETIHTTKQEVAQGKQRNWYLIIIILLLISSGVALYIRLRKRRDEELIETHQKHKEQKEIYHKDVLLKHRLLLIQKIDAVKAEQSGLRKKLTAAQKAALDKELYNDLLHFDDPNFFFSQMNAVLNNLVTKLKERDPKISNKQICWCCLFLLNIPTTDILLLLNYKVEGLDKMKQRLAAKLGLQQAPELTAFLDNILLSED